ncbi:DUF1642 domain-containing protein [Enterococcus faecium]|uniref:DUF1642 domain-containing protein n=1 Tax=Enterococcus faecium TaxID=1352 RepID=UPI003D24E0AA
MNTLDFKEGQTYICTKSNKRWFTVGKEYPVFLDSDNEPAIRDDGDDWHSSYLSISNNQFKLKEEQPKVTLDEPQKPVIPQFVAEWFEECSEELDWELSGLSGALVEAFRVSREERDDFQDWLVDTTNYPIETLVRMKLFGYEVEKEPLYEVIIGDLYLIKKFNNRNDFYFDTSCSLCAWEKSAYQLTEAEIKAIDERYWPFAVPVEEVTK